MRTALKIVGFGSLGLLLLIVGAGVYLVYFADWNMLRSPLASRISGVAGRDFRIDGDIDVDLGWTTHVTVDGIWLANASWGEAPALLEIGRLEFDIRLPALLRGRVELPEVLLDKPVLVLERDGQGENNWTFSKGPVAEATVPEERSEFPIIGHLKISDGRMRFRDEARKIDIESEVATATGKGQPATEEIRLTGAGTLEGRRLELRFVGGSLLSLREEDEPYPMEGSLTIGQTKLEFSGTMREPIKMQQVDAKLRLQGPNMAALFPILGVPAPDTPPYDVSGRLVREDSVWSFVDAKGKVGDSDLAGTLNFDTGRERLLISGELVSQNLDFDDLGLIVGAPVRTGGKETASKEQHRYAQSYAQRERVLPNAPLDLKRVRAVDAKLTFKGKKVDAGPLPFDDVALKLDLQNAQLKLAPLSFGFAGGKLDYYVTIDASRPDVPASHDIRLRGAQLADLLAKAGLENAGKGRFDGRIELKTVGDTIAKAAASADGRAALAMAGGEVQALAVEAIGLDVAESLALLATDKKAPTPIRCAVAGFDVVDGVMTSKVIVIDTIDSKITADATVDLGKETYQAKILAHPKDASLLSARAPVTVDGTFKSANVGVEAGALAAKGGVAVALGALLTPLAAILPFIDAGGAEDANCAALVSEAGKQTGAN
jgi:uncharacterized protein involved in outer membrane biogenesis